MVTCENVNWKSLGRSLLAVAQKICLKNSAEAQPLFRLKKKRRCRLSLMTKKSSGAAATATEKVAPLVAPAGEQRRCARHW